MRTLLASCALLFSLSVHAADRPTIRNIRFTGNRSIPDRDLLSTMVLKPDVAFVQTQLLLDMQSIVRVYNDRGMYFAAAHLDSLGYAGDSSSVELFVGISEGVEARIGDIQIEGDSVLTTAEIMPHMETRAGALLVKAALEHDINVILSMYEKIGYPFAKIDVKNISVRNAGDEPSLIVVLSIEEGQKIHIDEIRVAGNTETKENVIVRETRIVPQELFSEDKIKTIRPRLNRLNIFSSVQEPELYVTSHGGGLLITVQEGNTSTFDGIIGYVPAGGTGGEGIVTGLVNVSMRNLFGTARKLNVHWQRDDSRTQEIAFHYIEPWVFNFPVNLSGGFLQRQQDSVYIRRVVDAKADVLVSESFTVGGTFSHESIVPSGTLAVAQVSGSRTIGTGIEIRYDTRNDALVPTGGVQYQTTYQIGSKKISSPIGASLQGNTYTVQRIGLDAEMFFQPIMQQVLAVGMHGRQLTSSAIELGDLYRLGGTTTLRGYRENEFLGSRIAWTNLEYRFLLATRSYVFGFFDTGYFFLPGDDAMGVPSTQHVKLGYGVGIRLDTNLGNIGVSFAFGEGNSFSEGKIHIGLMNEF